MKTLLERAVAGWHWTRDRLRREVPQYPRWWGLYLQSAFFIGFYVWRQVWGLVPGIAIAGLALAAVVLTFRGSELKKGEQVVWAVICLFLFVWEIHAIREDRFEQEREHSAELAEQTNRFNATLQEFAKANSQNQTQFETTLKEADRIHRLAAESVRSAQQAIQSVIGSEDSYCLIFPAFSDGDGFKRYVAFGKNGPTPLYDLRVTIEVTSLQPDGLMGRNILTPTYSFGNAPAGNHVNCGVSPVGVLELTPAPGTGPPSQPNPNCVDIKARFSARNGDWYDDVYIRTAKGHYRTAYRVYRIDSTGKIVEIIRQVDPEFPPDVVKSWLP